MYFIKRFPPLFKALSNQQKAVLMSERVLGIEHPNTIQEYVSISIIFCTSAACSENVKLFYYKLNKCTSNKSLWSVNVMCFPTDAFSSVLLRQWPAVHCPEAAVPRSLPHARGVWRGPSWNGSARCKPLVQNLSFAKKIQSSVLM